jgi:hypothetical protein
MEKFTLVLFPDEKAALRGFDALDALRRKGVFVRGAALVERDEHGVLSLRRHTDGLLASLSAVVARAPNDLLEFLALDLAAGAFTLIAEVKDQWISPIAARMEWLGGRVVCEWGRTPATTRSSSGPWESRSSPRGAPPGTRRSGAGGGDTEVADRHGPLSGS